MVRERGVCRQMMHFRLSRSEGEGLEGLSNRLYRRRTARTFVTGATDLDYRTLPAKLDTSDYLVKPVELGELAAGHQTAG